MKSLQNGDPVAKVVPFRAKVKVGNRDMGRWVLDEPTALASATLVTTLNSVEQRNMETRTETRECTVN